MAELEKLKEFLGAPTPRRWSAGEWTAVENYIGSPLPRDFKAFMDAYGTGVIAEELVIFHPSGSSPLLDRMVRIHESFTESRERRPDDFPHPFHPRGWWPDLMGLRLRRRRALLPAL